MQRREFTQTSRTGKPRIWTIEVVGDRIFTSFGELGGKLQYVEDVGVRKNAGRANEISPEEDALQEAERQIRDKVRQGYSETGPGVDAIDWFAPLPINLRFYKPDNSLSRSLIDRIEEQRALFTRKREGEMTVIVKDGRGKVAVYSRTMHPGHHLEPGVSWNVRMPDLVRQLEGDTRIPPKSIFLGELVADPETDERWAVASFMKASTTEALRLVPPFFYCWDVAFFNGEDLVSLTPVQERYNLIYELFPKTTPPSSLVLPIEIWLWGDIKNGRILQKDYSSSEDALDVARNYARIRGWEGWVVVDPHGVYGDRSYNFRGKTDRPGRYCGKLKPEYELDAIALFDPDGRFLGRGPQGKFGTGNNRGLVGSIALYQINASGDWVYLCDCGSGIDDAFRQNYSNPRNYPLTVKIEYTSRTFKSAGDKTNALTHPRLVEVRGDKHFTECIEDRL